mgnify:CR=1 FL=1
MFLEFFDWFLKCFTAIFDTMKKFTLFNGFSYFNLVVALFAIPIIFKLIKFIMMIEDEEVYYQYTNKYTSAYDYIPKHHNTYQPKHAQYEPRHAKRKKGWFK